MPNGNHVQQDAISCRQSYREVLGTNNIYLVFDDNFFDCFSKFLGLSAYDFTQIIFCHVYVLFKISNDTAVIGYVVFFASGEQYERIELGLIFTVLNHIG